MDFDALAQQAVAAPDQATARVIPFPQQKQDDQFDDLAAQVMTMQRQAATSTLAGAYANKPDDTARALAASRTTGIPVPAAEENLGDATRAAQQQRDSEILFQNPKLQEFMGANPLAARMAQDDFDKLDSVSKLATAISSGAREAWLQNRMGRLGNVKQAAELVGLPAPQTDAEISAIEQQLARTPQMHTGLAFVQNFTGMVAGLIDNAARATEAGFAAAGAGAVVGAGAGGVGAIPGAVAGGALGFGVGFNLDAARVSAGQTYLRLARMVGDDGQPVSEAGKQFGALFAGAATYALFKYQTAAEAKIFGDTADKLAARAVDAAVTRPTFTAAFRKLAVTGVAGTAKGAAVMGTLEASNVIAEQIAQAISPGKFTTDPQQVVERLADAMVNGAALFGTMHTAMAGMGLYGDLANARRADAQAQMFKNLQDGAAGSKLRGRDLQSFQDFMQHQLQGQSAENVYVPAAKVLELYQSAKIDPNGAREADSLFGFVKDMPQQLREAAATNGDVVIPTADYVTHLAGTPVSEQLLPDVRVGAESMSVNEAEQYAAKHQEAAKEALEQAGKAAPEPSDLIAQDIQRQAQEAGRPAAEASRYAQIAAARFTTRAERLGVDPMELYRQEPLKIKSGEPGQAPALAQEERGSIRFEDGAKVISLFADADRSTLIHESGHAWLEELMADAKRPDAPQSLQDDAQAVLKWLGVDKVDPTNVEQHEQFARAAEAYLMEGKAPSRGLAAIFSRFKQWLTKIYRTISSLNTPINPEIRQVFDRLLATDEQIADARRTQGLEPAFRNREDAGMTSAEWGAYLKKIDQSRQEAESTLLDKTMARIRRQRTAEYKAEEAPVREDIAKQVDAQPDMQALNLITKGDVSRGTEPMRINRATALQMYGTDVANLPRGVLAKEGGVHPDVVAEATGFGSGDEMMRALMALEQRQREIRATEGERRTIRQYLIDQGVDAAMADRGTLDEASIRDEAIAAINGEQSQELQALELRYLNRRGVQAMLERGAGRKAVATVMEKADWDAAEQDLIHRLDQAKSAAELEQTQSELAAVRDQQKAHGVQERAERGAMREALNVTRPMLVALRAHADSIIDSKTVDELSGSFYKWARDERKAAGEVEAAIVKDDWATAAGAKQRQLLAGIMFAKARDAQSEVQSAQTMMEALVGRPKFSGMAQRYTDQIQQLLSRFGFEVKRDPDELARAIGKTSLSDFVQDEYESGFEIPLTSYLANAGGAIGSLRMPEFRDLADLVTSMRASGRIAQTVRVMDQTFDKEEMIAEMTGALAQIDQRLKGEFLYAEDRGAIIAAAARAASGMRSLDASLLKKERIFQWADGGDSNGPFNRGVFRPLKEAAFSEMQMKTDAVSAWRDLRKTLASDWSKSLADTIPTTLLDPETGQPTKITRKRLLSIALNWGTEDNAQKLVDGYRWQASDVKQLLDQSMTRDDWRFVQGVWDMFEKYREPLDALQRRVTGTGIEYVPGRSLDTPHGPIEGKYFPLVYDATKSVVAERNLERSSGAFFENQYQRATTRNGSAISRVSGVTQPVNLNLDVIPRKISQTIHDLAFREALMQSDKLLSDKRVIAAMDNTFGPEVRQTMRPWLQHIANVDNDNDAAVGWIDKVLNGARTNATMVGIGFRAFTPLKHGFSALAQSVTELGPRYMAQGVRETYGTPQQMRRTWQWAMANSDELKFRMDQYDRDVPRNVDRWINEGMLSRVNAAAQEYGHLAISYLDFGSAVPTWVGAVRKAQAEGMTDQDAYYYGDQTVRNAHGAQSIVDRAPIQESNSQIARMTTMFYGFLNHMYNQGVRVSGRQLAQIPGQVGAGQYGGAIRNFAQVAARTTGYLIVPGIVNALLRSGGPDENKDEGWWEWSAKAVASETAGTVPMVRDIADAALSGHDYEPTPLVRMVKTMMGTYGDVVSATGLREKQPSSRALQHALETFGYATGAPTGQAGATLQFLWDVNDGKVDPQTMSDWWSGLTKGRMDKQK